MKNTVVVVLLAVACLALGVWLIVSKKQAVQQKKADTETIVDLSNKWSGTSIKLDEREQVILNLYKDLANTNDYIARLTNDLGQTTANLSKTSADLESARQSIKAKEEEVAKRDARIKDLEAQNDSLDKRAMELTNAIAGLNVQIADTQRKLNTAEGDKAFLEKELKRLMGEKADLEKKFNDLEVLRVQVKRLKEELVIARRIEWIRKGLWGTDEKGASRLMERPKTATASGADTNRYDLNVEIGSDGNVRVIPPATNRPTTNSPPAR